MRAPRITAAPHRAASFLPYPLPPPPPSRDPRAGSNPLPSPGKGTKHAGDYRLRKMRWRTGSGEKAGRGPSIVHAEKGKFMDLGMNGKVALVTGGSRGIG